MTGGTNMLYSHFTEELLNLQEVIVKKIEKFENITHVHIEMPVTEHICPVCGEKTKYIHDYRCRTIKDLPAFDKNVVLFYRQRRYCCHNCGKRFAEKNTFVPKYYQLTRRLINKILDKTEDVRSFTSISKELNVSVSTVIRIFDSITYLSPDKLPEAVAIDEFKGNTGKEKYQVILTNPMTGEVLDILEDRKQGHLIKYLKQYDINNRSEVQFFVSDMWKPYHELAQSFFKNATYLVDKYHYVRQIIWAFERTRKRIQKRYGKEYRLMFKNSKRILTKRQSKLKPEQKERVDALLYVNDELRKAYYLKERFYAILDCQERHTAKEMMNDWLYMAQNSKLAEYYQCSNTLINWQKEILNTFEYPYSNGITEGRNNKIKVLKRNAYGYRNFRRFRNRILHIFSDRKRRNTEKLKEAA